MKVLLVINNINAKGNGLDASARTTIKHLKDRGIEVRTLSMASQDTDRPQPEYALDEFIFPIFQPLISAQNYCFAKPDSKVIREALEWADIVHIEEPFGLQRRVVREASRMGIPIVGTLHIFPENIFCNIKMAWSRFLNHGMMWIWKKTVFDYCSDIQCPTECVADRLRRFRYKAELHTISNGLTLSGSVADVPCRTDPYLITCIGRLSNEKDQYTLLHAMEYSRYSDRIQLHFAGAGPEEQRIKYVADDLYSRGLIKSKPIFGFYTIDELNRLSSTAYLYVHCATVEVEGLSCVEALRQGSVPVIARSPLSGTSQFALDERSTFKAKRPKELAAKIDWWIENPDEHEHMRPLYRASVEKYAISKSIDQLIEMYEKAIARK